MIRRLFVILFMVVILATACSALQEPPQQTVAPTPKKASIVKTIPKSPALAQAPTTTVTPTPTTVVAPIVATITSLPPNNPPLTPIDLAAAWTKVAICEEGGWGNYGFPAYPDSLGINATNWTAAGGTSDLSIDAQIVVAERFRAQYGISIPDQNGCAPW